MQVCWQLCYVSINVSYFKRGICFKFVTKQLHHQLWMSLLFEVRDVVNVKWEKHFVFFLQALHHLLMNLRKSWKPTIEPSTCHPVVARMGAGCVDWHAVSVKSREPKKNTSMTGLSQSWRSLLSQTKSASSFSPLGSLPTPASLWETPSMVSVPPATAGNEPHSALKFNKK